MGSPRKRRDPPAAANEICSSLDAVNGPASTSSPLPERPRSQRRMALEAKTQGAVAAAAAAAAAEAEASRGADSEADDTHDDDGQEKKVRFVWTRDLHSRFEQAVHQLGVAQAKPQAIRQLMGCETEEDLPTRQNIKSHLQKYRILLQKQVSLPMAAALLYPHCRGQPEPLRPPQAQQESPHKASGNKGPNSPPPNTTHLNPNCTAPSPAAATANQSPGSANDDKGSCDTASVGGSSGGGATADGAAGAPCGPSGGSRGNYNGDGRGIGSQPRNVAAAAAAMRAPVELLLSRHDAGILSQLEVYAKLHELLLEQRSTQAAIGWKLASAGRTPVLRRAQVQRMAEHVAMQRQLLQHLCTLLHASSVDVASFAQRPPAAWVGGRVRSVSLDAPPSLGFDDSIDTDGLYVDFDVSKAGGHGESNIFDGHVSDDDEGPLSSLAVPGGQLGGAGMGLGASVHSPFGQVN